MEEPCKPKENVEELHLSEEEAKDLADHLKQQLRNGKKPSEDEQNINLIVAGLGDKRGLLRRTFAESLGSIGTAAVPALREALLHDPNVIVRRAAAKTLKLIRDPSTLPDLLNALINDPDTVVQCSAAGAMAIFGEDAVGMLIGVLTKPGSTAMQSGLASWALSFVGAKAPSAIRDAAQSNDKQIRAAAISALGDQIRTLNDRKAKTILIKALEDPEEDVRSEATTLLGNLQDPSLADNYLLKKLSDKSSQVRKSAAISMMKLNSISYLKNLIERSSREKDSSVLQVIELAIKQIKLKAK